MQTHFRPKVGGRYGINSILASAVHAGDLTASSSDTIPIPSPNIRCAIMGLSMSAITVVIGAGTSTIIFYKYDKSATAAVALNTAADVEALVTKQGASIALLSTLTDAQRTLDDGDTLYAVVTTSSTISTQNVGLSLSVELAVIE